MNGLVSVIGIGLLLALTAPAAPADDKAESKGVVERALTAARADKLKEITSWTETGIQKFSDGTEVATTKYVRLPDHFRYEFVTAKGGKTTNSLFVVNGDKGWTKRDGKVQEV